MMNKYRRKESVEAVRFTQAMQDGTEPLPDCLYWNRSNTAIYLDTHGDYGVRVYVGRWIVYDGYGDVLTDEEFNERYELAESVTGDD